MTSPEPLVLDLVQPHWLMFSSNVSSWRHFEQKGIELRRIAGVSDYNKLDPLKLAGKLNLKVFSLDMLHQVPKATLSKLKNNGSWSGAATTPLSDGSVVIILNSIDSVQRRSATLMEEICHILLGHKPSFVGLKTGSYRAYNYSIENEAYGIGSAALVPHKALYGKLSSRATVVEISRYFGVTPSLVLYRVKGLRLEPLLS